MEKILKILKALSDETRLRIYLLLLKGELYVCELVHVLDMEQSRISHGLRILKEAGLVIGKREGTWIVYSANREMLKNKVLRGMKEEVSLPAEDIRRLDTCKRDHVKEKCIRVRGDKK